MECKGCMWMLLFVIGPLALFAACGVLALRGWAVRAALRLTQQANDRAASAQDAGVRAERALDTLVHTGESDV